MEADVHKNRQRSREMDAAPTPLAKKYGFSLAWQWQFPARTQAVDRTVLTCMGRSLVQKKGLRWWLHDALEVNTDEIDGMACDFSLVTK